MGRNLYLRDLKPVLQEEFLRRWKEQGRTDLLEAVKNGEDIAIGYYFEDGTEEIVN